MEGLTAGRVALVTGGGRGIGRGTCLELARHGADVAVADLDAATAVSVADEVRALGRRAVGLAADVTTADGRRAMLEAAAELGPLDILVNNAGILRVVDAFDVTESDWDRMFAVNAKAVFFLCQAALPAMIQRGRGAVVNVASTAGKGAASPVLAHYSATKAAVIAITKTWSAIAARHGVRVNCVCPGYIDTAMWTMLDRELAVRRGRQPGEVWRESIELVPLGRGGTPDDVGRVIAFLASDMAGYMTGQAINVSGGLVTY
jgi:NAD(P)-dependent dehydrogenase (short-subunit alcohol dehydrogenase family)